MANFSGAQMSVSPTAPTRPQPVLHGRLRLWSVKQIHSRVYALLFFSVYQGLVVFTSPTLIFSILVLLFFLHPPKTPKRSINTTLVPCTQRTQLARADCKFHRRRGCLCRNGSYWITARLPRPFVFVEGKTKSVPCVHYRSSFRVQGPCRFYKSNFNFHGHRVVVFSASP